MIYQICSCSVSSVKKEKNKKQNQRTFFGKSTKIMVWKIVFCSDIWSTWGIHVNGICHNMLKGN